MYLSKIDLNLKSKLVRKDLRDCYELHRTLYNCFSHHKDNQPGRIIYRVEDFFKPILTGDNYCQSVLVVSEKQPDWTKPAGNYLINSQIIDYSKKLKYFNNNSLYSFHLRANPTKKNKGKRIPLKSNDERINWLKRKSGDNGFKVIDASFTVEFIQSSTSKKEHTLTFNSVLYEGLLKIDDMNIFRNALFYGIGSAKAFGFGLLTIRK